MYMPPDSHMKMGLVTMTLYVFPLCVLWYVEKQYIEFELNWTEPITNKHTETDITNFFPKNHSGKIGLKEVN